MAVAWQQQVFALDARYNAHRAPNHPNFRTLYIRRRSQLLREHTEENLESRKEYLALRSQLLQKRYGSSHDGYSRSNSSIRSNSRISETYDSKLLPPQGAALIPTRQAEASRAIVGGNTIAENYAFTGVHHIFDQHKAAVTIVKFANNDRSRLLCASLDGTLSICEVAEEPCVAVILKGHTKPVTGCDWSISNDLVASCSVDGTVRLWDTKTGNCLRTVVVKPGLQLLCCLFQFANNNLVITGNDDGEIRTVNVSTGRCPPGGVCKIGGRVLSIACDSNGHILWAGNDKGEIVSVLSDMTGQLRKARRIQISINPCSITSISWRSWISREARDPSLLVNSTNNTLSLFRVMDSEGGIQLKWRFTNKHNEHLIRSTFCPIMSFRQGACVVTGNEDSCVYFLDIERSASRAIVNRLQGHASATLGVSFNYDESLLATSDQQGLVIIWRRTQL